MAERLDIVVSESGSRVVRRNIDDVGKAGVRANKGVDLLRRTLGLLGGAFAVRQILGFADSFTELQNQIRVASGETADLGATTQRLFDISSKTRTSIEANVQLFQRLSFAAGELGASQEQLFKFVETTGKALAIQGGSASSASGALLQLSQAIGSGIVRAEEFNSILEGAFPIALAVAAGLDKAGGSVAKLRQLIIAGEVSSTEFFDALLSQSDALEKAFARTTPTISQAFTVLRNNAIQFFGELDKGTGVTAVISQSILKLANNLDTVGLVAGVAGSALAAAFAPRLIGLIGNATRAVIGFAVALGPIGLAVAVLAGLAVAAQELTGGLFELQGTTVIFGDVVTATFNVLGDVFQTVSNVLVQTLAPAFASVGTEIGSLRDILAGVFNFFVRTLDTLVGVVVGTGRAIGTAIAIGFKDLPAAIEGAFIAGFNGALRVAESSANFIFGILRKLGVDIADVTFDPFIIKGSESGQEAAAAISDAFRSGLDVTPVQDIVDLIGEESVAVAKLREEQEKITKATVDGNDASAKALELNQKQASSLETLTDRLDPLGALTRQFKDDQELLNLALKVGAVSTAEYAKLQGALNRQFDEAGGTLVRQYNLQTEAQLELLREIRGPADDYAKTVADLNFLLGQGALSQEQFNGAVRDARIAMLETQTDAVSGIERGLLKLQRDANDVGSQVESALVGAFNSAEDAMVEFVQSGKFEFKDLVKSIQADLTRLAVRTGITGPLSGLVSGAFGGGGGTAAAVSGLGSLIGFANGGDAVVGGSGGTDSQLVKFKATPGETISVRTPAQQRSASGEGRPIMMNFNFPPGTDVEDFRRNQEQVAASLSRVVTRANQRNN